MNDRRLGDESIRGRWKIVTPCVSAKASVESNHADFNLILLSNHHFCISGIPQGVFFDDCQRSTRYEGRWSAGYGDGHNYLQMCFTNLPGIMPDDFTMGSFGAQIEMMGGYPTVRLGQFDGHSFYMAPASWPYTNQPSTRPVDFKRDSVEQSSAP